MPPTVALTICLAFVIFMLRIERKQLPDVRRTVWIPTIWLLYIASKPLAIWFPGSGATQESSPMDRLFQIGLLLLAIYMLGRARLDWARVIKDNRAALLVLGFMLFSILWSSIPSTSFNRWVRELLSVAVPFLLIAEPSPRQAMEAILRRTSYIAIPFSLLLIKYYPYYGIAYGRWTGTQMWIGVAQQKNSLASLCIISAFFLMWSLVRRRQKTNPRVWKYQTHAEIFLLLLTFYLLGGPGHDLFYSATSVYALVAGLLIYAGLHYARKFGVVLAGAVVPVIVLLIIVFGTVSVFLGGSTLGSMAVYAGRDSTLTGRTQVWGELLPVAMQAPLTGYGFGAFWTPKTRELYKISGAHSGYLDTILGIGLIGLGLVALFLVGSSRKSQRVLGIDYDWGILCICCIIMVCIHNIGESSIDSFSGHLMAVVLFLSITFPQQIPAETAAA